MAPTYPLATMITDPLISNALLGTARMTALPQAPDGSLEKTWLAIDSENPTTAILKALALTRAFQLAGAKTIRLQEGEKTAVTTADNPLPSAAVDLALRLLTGEFSEILPEWMSLATKARCNLPPRILPELLSMGAKNQGLRPAVINLSGERGLWIARRYKEYEWLLDASQVDENAWETGSPFERIAFLRHTRAADPSAAANLISSHWSEEDASMRESILKLVAENPQSCDEPWLETLALKDRRKEIRDLAAVSLVNISTSSFRIRSLERVNYCLKIERRFMKRAITIHPPFAFDPTWAADGIKEKPPTGIGEKAWWLRQLISHVPLDEYPELFDVTEDDLFSITRDKDWQTDVVIGWIESALRYPKRALAKKFIPFIANLQPWPANYLNQTQIIQTVLESLSTVDQYEILDKLAKNLQPHFALDLLARIKTYPPDGHGKTILSILDNALSEKTAYLTRPQCRALAVCIHPNKIQNQLERLAKLPELSAPAEEFATTLEFRRSMISQFKLLSSNE